MIFSTKIFLERNDNMIRIKIYRVFRGDVHVCLLKLLIIEWKGYFLNFPFLCARVSGKISRTARLHAGPQWIASESWAVELIFCRSKSRETFPFGNRHIISTMIKIKGIISKQGQNTLKISTDYSFLFF